LEVQRRALALLAEAVAAGEASPRELALLRDRVLVNEGNEQIYGTQIAGVRDGAPVPWPCVDPERLDDRRAEVDLEPFAVHVTRTEPAPDPWYERKASVTGQPGHRPSGRHAERVASVPAGRAEPRWSRRSSAGRPPGAYGIRTHALFAPNGTVVR
jgi:hypothetical protein